MPPTTFVYLMFFEMPHCSSTVSRCALPTAGGGVGAAVAGGWVGGCVGGGDGGWGAGVAGGMLVPEGSQFCVSSAGQQTWGIDQ